MTASAAKATTIPVKAATAATASTMTATAATKAATEATIPATALLTTNNEVTTSSIAAKAGTTSPDIYGEIPSPPPVPKKKSLNQRWIDSRSWSWNAISRWQRASQRFAWR